MSLEHAYPPSVHSVAALLLAESPALDRSLREALA